MQDFVVLIYGEDDIEVYSTEEYSEAESELTTTWVKALSVAANNHIHAAYLAGKEG